MQSLPLHQRLFFGYIGRVNGFARAAASRSFLGTSLGGWLSTALIVALLWGLIRSWPAWLMAVLLGLLLWLVISLRAARRANYNRFLPTNERPPTPGSLPALEVNRRLPLTATGVFSVSSRDCNVLERPGHIWQVPLGDHVVMVEHAPGKFAYQFFNAGSLQSVRKGWLLTGARPISCLALSFNASWGPDYTKFEQFDDGRPTKKAPQLRTVYLTFHDIDTEQTVWHNVTRVPTA